jgi:hypothetical protein
MFERDGERIGLRGQDLQAHSLGFVRYLTERVIEVPVEPGRHFVRHQTLGAHAARSASQCNPPVFLVRSLPPQWVDGIAATGRAALEALAEAGSAGTTS